MSTNPTPEETDAAVSEKEACAQKLRLQAKKKREEEKNVGTQVKTAGSKQKPDALDRHFAELKELHKSRQLKER